jgi:5-amino-6-(5-phospho-D-ribitylamino)uracil phosphatase
MHKPAGLFAVDIDGTLITDHGHITGQVKDALERAFAAGWEIVPATGRTYPAARGVVGELPFVRYAVVSNGAVIVDVKNNTPAFLEKLTPETAAAIIRVTRSSGAVPALYTTDIDDQKVLYDTLEGASDYFSWYIREDQRTHKVTDVMDHTGDVLQIGMIASRQAIFAVREAVERLDATMMALPFESPRFGGKVPDVWFGQVVARHARKHLGLKRLASMIGIPEGRLVAAGDNYNDTEMLEAADVGVAMGNAPDEVKACADLVVASNNDHGLAEVVDMVILSNEWFS